MVNGLWNLIEILAPAFQYSLLIDSKLDNHCNLRVCIVYFRDVRQLHFESNAVAFVVLKTMGRRSGGGGGLRSGGGEHFSARDNSKLIFSSCCQGQATEEPTEACFSCSSSSPVQSQPAAGGLGSSFADGMAFGGGNAVGHRAVDAVLGPRVRHEVAVADPDSSAGSTTVNATSCAAQMNAFQECLNVNGSDLSKCQFYMDMLCECRRSFATGLFA
ncbi:uncharacterized protein LOC132034837 [Lycium ferocissimum]|uniref:uncharacterized protein LOC132034837 n=1 Tax=Lycium ferocissimum TaxID=112874 RepID=UPI0028158B89|nr:uncharacterized protein LOC132034837 [Lycium ferocissimum]